MVSTGTCGDSFVMMSIPTIPPPIHTHTHTHTHLLFPVSVLVSPALTRLSSLQAEHLKEQASSWEEDEEDEEREVYTMTHRRRPATATLRCKNPYRPYERHHAPGDRDRSDSEDEDEDEDEDEEFSDGSPPILTKAHAMLGVKRKVIVLLGEVTHWPSPPRDGCLVTVLVMWCRCYDGLRD